MKAVGGREGDNNFNVRRGTGQGWGGRETTGVPTFTATAGL